MADPDNSSDKNGKVSDSAYSKSYNSQSTRSCNSALRSGSNSSGSSGYGGDPSSGSSGASKSHAKRKDKDTNKDISNVETEITEVLAQNTIELATLDEIPVPASKDHFHVEVPTPKIKEDVPKPQSSFGLQNTQEDFSCMVSMKSGVIINSTNSLRNILGYPQEMWVGRSFIDFVHPRDQGMFASQISNIEESSLCVHKKELQSHTRVSLHCRLRQYNNLVSTGFEIKAKSLAYLPFKLVLSFYGDTEENPKEIIKPIEKEEDTEMEIDNAGFENFQGAYIIIQAASIVTAYQGPLEILANNVAFVLRHSVLGVIEHIDAASMPYLGYMPHDLVGRCAIKMYHPEDLCFLRRVYETVVKLGKAPKTSFRMLTQNGDYVRVETDFKCFVNPWSRKMEYITGHHIVIQGPCEIHVFGAPDPERSLLTIKKVRINAEIMRDQILRIMNECLTKRAEIAKQQMSRKCQNLSNLMETFMEKPNQELHIDCTEKEHSLSEKDSVILGGVSPHNDNYDSNSASTDTSPSYNQMNYKENLQRFFDSEPITHTGQPEELAENLSSKFRSHCKKLDGAMESEDDDDSIRFTLTSEKDKNRPRLTEAALKKHNQEMEIVMTKEHKESRYRPEKKMLTRQRLDHLARCNIYHDQNTSNVFLHPKIQAAEYTPSHTTTKRDHNLKRERSHVSRRDTVCAKGEVSQCSKYDHSPKRRELKREKEKHGVKRNLTTASMSDKEAPHKQAKSGNLGQAGDVHSLHICSPLPSTSFNTSCHFSTSPMPDLGVGSSNAQPAVPMSRHTNTFVNTVTPSVSRHNRTMAYSPAFMRPVWTDQIELTNRTPIMTPVPHVNSRVCANQMLSKAHVPIMNPGGQTRQGLYPLMCLPNRMVAHTQATQDTNMVPFMVYSNMYGQQFVYTQMHPSFDYKQVASRSPRNSNRRGESNRMGGSDESWNRRNEQTSSSDQDNNKAEGDTSSSFYSSFLKMDSSSEDQGKSSSDKDSISRNRSKCMKWVQGQVSRTYSDRSSSGPSYQKDTMNNTARPPQEKNMESPWMRDVIPSKELFYRYQMPLKNLKETLNNDKKFLAENKQSDDVNEQLTQLYIDLHLQGVTSSLTLEEGITSSASSGEEALPAKAGKKRKPYSKLAIIYEEEAPFPSDEEFELQTHYIPVQKPISQDALTCSNDDSVYKQPNVDTERNKAHIEFEKEVAKYLPKIIITDVDSPDISTISGGQRSSRKMVASSSNRSSGDQSDTSSGSTGATEISDVLVHSSERVANVLKNNSIHNKIHQDNAVIVKA